MEVGPLPQREFQVNLYHTAAFQAQAGPPGPLLGLSGGPLIKSPTPLPGGCGVRRRCTNKKRPFPKPARGLRRGVVAYDWLAR